MVDWGSHFGERLCELCHDTKSEDDNLTIFSREYFRLLDLLDL